MIKIMHENDYSETDEFTLIKEMNHWIKDLKKFFVDDKKAQKAIADYFYYDDGKHQEDFKELQSSVKTLHKLWLKLDNIVEEAEEREYKKSKNESYRLKEEDTEIEVENPGLLEVPEGKNVDDLPLSHFVKLANKKGLSKIVKGLNNLQVWNKNKDPKLSKWAGDMIDKLNKKLKKEESYMIRIKESINKNELKDMMYDIGLDYKGVGRTGNLVFYDLKADPTDVKHLYIKFNSWDEVEDYLNSYDEDGFMDECNLTESNRDRIDRLISDMEVIGFEYDGTDNRGRLLFNSWDGNSTQAFPDWEEVRNYLENGSEPFEFESCDLTEDYKNDLKKFADANIDKLKSIANKCGYKFYNDSYYKETKTGNNSTDYDTVLCYDFYEIPRQDGDMNRFDKELNRYFKKFDFRYILDDLPSRKTLCIYY